MLEPMPTHHRRNTTFTPRIDGVFGRYRVFEPLGSGGVGEVFRARDTEIGRSVALKVLRPLADGDPALARVRAARLLREARAAATIHHPNAVVVFDAGEHDGVPYLVMELVQGKTLRAVIGDPTIRMERKIGWLLDIARALGAAHKKGIVHQDVKPENVMLRDDGVIKVLDFGIARRVFDAGGAQPGAERSDGIYGTPAYVAPERVHGEMGDGLADQFSWGVVAYELLVGEHPWGGDDPAASVTARMLARPPPRPPAERCPEIPKVISRIVLRALSERPRDRFESMDEVIRAMARGWSATAPWPLRALRRVREPWRRRGLAAVGSFAIALTAWIATPPRFAPTRGGEALDAGAFGAAGFGSAISADAQAATDYRAGVEAARRAAGDAAQADLARAVARDPSFAAAHLRAFLFAPRVTDVERANLRTAARLKGALGDHDRALADALEPWLDASGDLAEVERRLASLAAARGDPDFFYALCKVRLLGGSYARAADACRAARTIDPAFADALRLEGEAHLALGDRPSATLALEACVHASPAATSCLRDLARTRSGAGACSLALDAARGLVDLEPEDTAALVELGGAMAATGADDAAVRDVFDRALASLEPARRAAPRAALRAHLAASRGDFAAARRELDTWDAAAHDEADRGEALLARASLERETGREATLVPRARAVLAARDAAATEVDRTIVALVVSYRTGAIARGELAAGRAAWWTREVPPTARDPRVVASWRWVTAYAYAALTADEAEEALALVPDPPLDPVRDESFDEAVGATLLLAGRRDEAIRFLRRAAGSCRAALTPFPSTWAHLELGEALEPTDTPGACAAYRVVLDRWGDARGSKSADRARRRRAALRCE